MTMRCNMTIPTLCAMLLVTACGNADVEPASETDDALPKGDAPSVTFSPGDDPTTSTATPAGPVRVSYRIIGKPVVGQPVAIDLNVRSTLGPQPVTMHYRINDASAMQFAKSQPDRVAIAPAEINERGGTQQVTVIPMREGRLYLNVSASVETDTGSMSTVTAIPIQVGDAPRQLEEQGELQTDEEGNAVRVLPAKEN